jgi:hypothetical protein
MAAVAVSASILLLCALPVEAGTRTAEGCGTALAWGSHGQHPILVPPNPEVWVKARSSHVFLFRWSFASLPSACRPALLLLTIRPDGTRYLPKTERLSLHGRTGTATITLASFSTPGSEALVSALAADGRRSSVLRGPVGHGEWRRLGLSPGK